MKARKTMALLLALTLITGSLAGCGSGEGEKTQGESSSPSAATDADDAETPGGAEAENEWYGTEDGQTVTLQFWAGIQAEYGYAEIEENFNKEYADKGVQIQFNRYMNNSDGNLQLETYLMAGENGGVDVFIGYGDKKRLLNRAESGLLYEYSDYLDSIGFDIAAELGAAAEEEYVFEDGAVWGLPTKFDNKSYIMINKDMFDEAGIEIPYNGWTYAEFMDALEKLTHGEGQDKVYGICWGFDFGSTIWSNNISSVLNPNAVFGDDSMTWLNWEDPVWIEGFELVMETFEKGYAPTLADDLADSMTVQSMLLEEKCAIFCNATQLRLSMDTETYPHDFTTALVPFPVPSEEYAEFYTHAADVSSGDFICIASGCKYKEAACEFARWYVQGGMNPLLKAARYPLWLGTDMDMILSYIEETAGDTVDIVSMEHLFGVDRSSVVKATYVNGHDSELSTIFWEEAQDFLYGVTPTAEEALKKAVERGTELLTE